MSERDNKYNDVFNVFDMIRETIDKLIPLLELCREHDKHTVRVDLDDFIRISLVISEIQIDLALGNEALTRRIAVPQLAEARRRVTQLENELREEKKRRMPRKLEE